MPTDGPYIAEIAALVGDPARANMLTALMGGQALTASELAAIAGVTPQTASGHLAKLSGGCLVVAIRQGRHRYHRLASGKVAEMLEGLMALAADGPPRHRPASLRDDALAQARTCYHHLAGRLGVAMTDALVARDLIILGDEGGAVTSGGFRFFQAFEVDVKPQRAGICFCRPCLDWSERRWHLGGHLGRALADRLFALDWIARRPGCRAVTVTALGQSGFADMFGIVPFSPRKTASARTEAIRRRDVA